MAELLHMMQRAGWLGAAEVEQVERHRAAHGGCWVDAILSATVHHEDALADFFQNKLMLPAVDAQILAQIDTETLSCVPGALAWKHQVLPVSRDDLGNLTLAMLDPTDLEAVELVAAQTNMTIIRAAVGASTLRAALERHYGSAPVSTMRPRMVAAAANERSLLPTAWARTKPYVLGSVDRDALTEALLDFGSTVFERTLLFVHLRDELRGHAGRGDDLLEDAVAEVRIPMAMPSTFADVVQTGQAFVGQWPTETVIDRAFCQALGHPENTAVLIPFTLRDKIPILMFGSGLRAQFDPQIFGDLAHSVEHALEQLLVRRRASSE